MSDEQQVEPEHVFDQTNGMVPAEDERPSVSSSERERRRAQSSALAYGLFGTGHQ